MNKKTLQKMADGMLDDSIRHRVRESVRRNNARLLFDDLIVSLKGKRKLTPSDRMRYRRVVAFLKT